MADRSRQSGHRVPSELLSVWATAQRPGPSQRRGRYLPESVKHPARMLPAIAAHAIARYTRPGDLVLDPMCGIGTTLVEAAWTGRDALGVEYEARWAQIADANIRHAHSQGAPGRASVVRGDSTHLTRLLPARLHGQVALVVTSPPYGPTTHGLIQPGAAGVAKHDNSYGDPDPDRGNLAHRNHTDLLHGFTRILRGCAALLHDDGVVVVTARPYRKHGHLLDLPGAVLSLAADAGLVPLDRFAALLAGARDGRLVARPSFFQLQQTRNARSRGVPLHLIAHEDVLVLAKSRTSLSSGELKCSHPARTADHGKSRDAGKAQP